MATRWSDTYRQELRRSAPPLAVLHDQCNCKAQVIEVRTFGDAEPHYKCTQCGADRKGLC